MSLKIYHAKRNFKKTPEPAGTSKRRKTSKPLLFVIQKHAASHLHYDFRLELAGVLLSWAVPKGPCLDPTVKRLAMHVEDHPIEYGDFEGIIPKGQYGGGTVMLWDQGQWIPEAENPEEAYRKGNMTFTLDAKKLKGKWKLIRIRNDDKAWLLIKIQDAYARSIDEYDITKAKPNSVVSQRSIEEIAENSNQIWNEDASKKSSTKKTQKKSLNSVKTIKIELKPAKMPTMIHPQLATLVDKPPSGKKWLHEIKFDGYRILAFKNQNHTKLITRNNNDWTNKFKNVAAAINKLPVTNAIFDGEIVVLDESQHSNFQMLQNSIKRGDNKFIYYVFDLLYYDKYNLMSLPLIERKNILHKMILSVDGPVLRYSDHIQGSGEQIFKKICALSLEGIVSKDSNSEYIQKRGKNWLKLKYLKRQEFVIGGFTRPGGKRKYFGSLLLGAFNRKHQLIYHGNVGTGFTEASLESLYSLLLKNQTERMPFYKTPPDSKNAIWVKPVLVAEVEFLEWTDENYLRHPSFKGLRSDKPTKSIKKETEMPIRKIESENKSKSNSKIKLPVKLTNPNKILFSEDSITKHDLAEYFARVEKWLFPYIKNRPLALVRCPDSYTKCFFQKHINETTPDTLRGIKIKEKGIINECIFIDDHKGLMSLPQLGVIEVHPWGSTIKKIEYPDIIVFDLDPGPNVAWSKVVSAAFDIKKNLSDLKLKSFVKATGGKGLHVVVPIKPEYDWDEIKNFSHVFADYIVAQKPKEYVAKMTKTLRAGKIYIDYLRNQRGATAIAPYSPRSRIHAPVATPIDWDELTGNIKDTLFTIQTLPERLENLKQDPWKDFFKIRQSLRIDKLVKSIK